MSEPDPIQPGLIPYLQSKLRLYRWAMVDSFSYDGFSCGDVARKITDHNLTGNRHCVIEAQAVGSGASTALLQCEVLALCRELSQERPIVFAIILRSEGSCVHACFIQHGYEIARCGSGALAVCGWLHQAALVTQNQLPREAAWTLHNREGIPIWRARYLPGLHHYSLERLPPSVSPVSPNVLRAWQRVVNQPVDVALRVGAARDYMALVLADATAVSRAAVNTRWLCRFHSRALILTGPVLSVPFQACSSHSHASHHAHSFTKQPDYVLRYFAPQYGQVEDAATGSAHWAVATYWLKRLRRAYCPGQFLQGEQRPGLANHASHAASGINGGRFAVARVDGRIYIAGKVHIRLARNL